VKGVFNRANEGEDYDDVFRGRLWAIFVGATRPIYVWLLRRLLMLFRWSVDGGRQRARVTIRQRVVLWGSADLDNAALRFLQNFDTAMLELPRTERVGEGTAALRR